jgi:hypothetical protein
MIMKATETPVNRNAKSLTSILNGNRRSSIRPHLGQTHSIAFWFIKASAERDHCSSNEIGSRILSRTTISLSHLLHTKRRPA